MTKVIYEYIATDGAFYHGIPARDLTQADVDRIGEDAIEATGLYKKLVARKRAAKKQSTDRPDEYSGAR